MFPKTGKKLPSGNDAENGGAHYSAIVAGALNTDLGETHRAAKVLMRWTGASERTVKHWLTGTHGPRGDYLLVLMRESEVLFEAVLGAIGRRDAAVATKMLAAQRTILDIAVLVQSEQARPQGVGMPAAGSRESFTASGKIDRDNDRSRDRDHDRRGTGASSELSRRQSWFLEKLNSENKVGVSEFMQQWGVSEKTARRDIAALKARRLIEFVGSRRSGRYRPSR
jgi:hypothetical protein